MNGAVRLIATREITSRLQQRGFRLGFAAALLVVVIACVLPSFFSDDSGPAHYDVAVVGDQPTLAAVLDASAHAGGPRFTVHDVTEQTARAKVRDGSWDAAVLPGRSLLAKTTDSTVVGLVQQAYRQATTVDRLRNAGLSATQIDKSLSARPLAVTGAESAAHNQRQAIAIVTVIVLFGQLMTFCTWVAMGVVEEKASRVVELILSSVRPLQLLAGKLLGIGVLAAAQLLAIGVVAMVAASAAGTISIPASALATVAVSFVAFVLGFAFFASLAAALGSTVSRQEEVSGILMPVTLSLLVCYGASFATASSPDSTGARVLSIVPPVSALSMPGRIAHGSVPVLDVVLAAALLIVTAAAMIAVAARIYRASILHGGTRVSLARAWRGEAVASAG